MKILKRGTFISKTVFRGICVTCLSLIEAERNEVQFFSDIRERDTIITGICPVCKNDMHFKEENIKVEIDANT